MKDNKYFLNCLLTAVVFAALTVAMIVRIAAPAAVIPPLNIPNMVLLSVITLLLEFFLTRGNPRCYLCSFLFAMVIFGVLPLMAGFACQHTFWKLGIVGGVVFTATTFLFTSAIARRRTGPKAPAAAVVTALGIYLAAQCFAGMIL